MIPLFNVNLFCFSFLHKNFAIQDLTNTILLIFYNKHTEKLMQFFFYVIPQKRVTSDTYWKETFLIRPTAYDFKSFLLHTNCLVPTLNNCKYSDYKCISEIIKIQFLERFLLKEKVLKKLNVMVGLIKAPTINKIETD